jgi:hypothetical protein
MSNQTEGVIKYQLEYTPAKVLPWTTLREINAWRQLMYQLSLIGQDPTRYGGFGYGNISQRLEPFEVPPAQRAFVISGSQTGGLTQLTAEHYTTVHQCHPAENRLVASGPLKPSSESLTHGAVYATSSQIGWVLHAHSPHIWRHAESLGLPITHPSVPYGTPEMAAEVARLFAETNVAEQGIFSMGGHEDGIVAFGPTGEESFSVLVTCLGQAMALD